MPTKILVIEDDLLLRSNICELLEAEGYIVSSAKNGRMGLDMAKSESPDLIISDIMMPEMNGFELLEKLMEDSITASIPLIFLTARVEPESLRKGMNLGADDYLIKPFNAKELLDAIEIRLKKKDMVNHKIKSVKEQIAAKIPHELRTPLVPIMGYAELIEGEDDLAQVKDMVKIIRKHGKTLHSKIEKFLLYKDLITHGIDKSYFEGNKSNSRFNNEFVSVIISDLNEDLKPLDRVKIDISPISLLINEWYLTVVVKELIENGLKYSGENKNVIIQGYCEKDNYKISVMDLGRGLSENEIKSITAFQKFGADHLSEPGIGLGLSIVQKIIEQHNGLFSIKSEVNKNTICEVSLKLC